MFLTNQDEILVNEVAPRPHNSYHFSIDERPENIKNKSIKFVLCQKGGIFSSDKIIGKFQILLYIRESYTNI